MLVRQPRVHQSLQAVRALWQEQLRDRHQHLYHQPWQLRLELVQSHSLVSGRVRAPYFDGAHLLIAADCTAYAYGNFHNDFIKGRKVVVGCPKLDDVDYAEKLTAIIANNDIKGVTIVRMEVPCCGGLERAAITALQNSGRFIPWQVVTISTDGRILQ